LRSKEDVVEEFRKQAICDAAMRVVARKGIQKVTVQDIADEAGVAKGTVYIYFDSREEIVATTMDAATEKLLVKLAAACGACKTFRDLLERRVRTQLQHFEEHRDLFRLYLAMCEPLGERRLRRHSTYVAYLSQLEDVLREAVARGDIRDAPVDRMAVSISSVIRDIALQRISDREPAPLDDDVRYAVEFIISGIGQRVSRKSRGEK
jgi:TetR/AcrR family fatty acid metabolism transcriptional regulator